MAKYTDIRTVAANALEDLGIHGTTHLGMAKRWAKTAAKLIGAPSEYCINSERVDLDDCNDIPIPDALMSTRAVYLCRNDGYLIEAAYGGHGVSDLWDPDGCCRFYRFKSSAYDSYDIDHNAKVVMRSGTVMGGPQPDVVLGEDKKSYFFMAGDPSIYTHAIVEYNGFPIDRKGEMMVPDLYSEPLSQWISFKWTKRERKADRRSVPAQEVQDDFAMFERITGVAYGQVKHSNKAVVGQWILERYGVHLRNIPKRSIRV